MKSSKSNTKISVATTIIFEASSLRHISQRPLKPFTIFEILIEHWCYKGYETGISQNLEITGCWVVQGLWREIARMGPFRGPFRSDYYTHSLWPFSFCLISRPTLNFTIRLAGTWTCSRVFGFCAVLAARVSVSKTSKSRNSKRLPLASSMITSSEKS